MTGSTYGNGHIPSFSHDNLDRLINKSYSGVSGYYYYVFNVQGDVVGMLTGNGVLFAKYNYDAWGNLISATDASGAAITSSSHMAIVNPIRYRGYYYDNETGFYWLQSRYYDPVTGRFINADGYVQTGDGMLDKSMFTYCLNNPVMYL